MESGSKPPAIRIGRFPNPDRTAQQSGLAAPNSQLYPRFAASLAAVALADTPVVMVIGPRQCGKTTMVRDLVRGRREFLTMDDDTVLSSARSDPSGLVRGLAKSTIDEIQRAPDLLRAMKRRVDEARTPGSF